MLGKKIIAGVLIAGLTSLWGAGVAGSPHDLGSFAFTGANASDDNGELCVYCHTPHASNTAFTGAPIWNKDGNGSSVLNTGFTTYGTTIAGETASTTVNAPSMACLSCHDGVSAINSVVNAPGAGLGTGLIGTTAMGIDSVFMASNNAVANLGSDLTNDHPVSITYVPGNAGLRDTNTTLTGWAGVTEISQVLRAGFVECGSCHDPHDGADTGATGSQVHFLRASNAGSALCIGCHEK